MITDCQFSEWKWVKQDIYSKLKYLLPDSNYSLKKNSKFILKNLKATLIKWTELAWPVVGQIDILDTFWKILRQT